jgi:hypothetical protein
LKAKWPSYQEHNLEARMKSPAKEEQHMTVEMQRSPSIEYLGAKTFTVIALDESFVTLQILGRYKISDS